MTDYTDPESPVADPHVAERKRYFAVYMGEGIPHLCLHCRLPQDQHIHEGWLRFCPEWRLRQLDGDR